MNTVYKTNDLTTDNSVTLPELALKFFDFFGRGMIVFILSESGRGMYYTTLASASASGLIEKAESIGHLLHFYNPLEQLVIFFVDEDNPSSLPPPAVFTFERALETFWKIPMGGRSKEEFLSKEYLEKRLTP